MPWNPSLKDQNSKYFKLITSDIEDLIFERFDDFKNVTFESVSFKFYPDTRIRTKFDLNLFVIVNNLDLFNSSLMIMVELYRLIRDEQDIFGKFHVHNTFTDLKHNFEFYEKERPFNWFWEYDETILKMPKIQNMPFCQFKVKQILFTLLA